MADNSTDQSSVSMHDIHAAAKRLGVSECTVKREVKRKAIGFYRVGSGNGRLRFSDAHLQAYLNARENIYRVEQS